MALLPHVRQGHSIISTPPDAAPPMGKRKPSLNPPSHAINRNQPKANPGEPIDLVSQGQETDYDVDSDFERELQISYGEAHAQGKKKRTQVLQNAVQEKTVSVHVHATPVSIQSRSDPRNSDDMTVRQFGEETQMVAESSIQEQQAEEVTSSWRREVGDDADYHHFADTPHKLDNEGAEDEEDWEEASSSDENGFSHVTASLETALFECSDINPQTRIETQPGRGEKRAYSRNSYVPPQGSGFEGSERFIRPGDRETHARMNRREPSYRHFLKPKYPTDKRRNERAKRSGNQERGRSAEDRRCGTFLLLGKGRGKGRERGAASEPDAGDLAANLEDRDSNTKKR